jgi:4-amino-4-deoxy-L-arabinose transferase-like glycosyltransferase
MTRLLHVDALLTPLLLISVLAGLLYWLQGRRWPLLVLSAVTGGLALLTKAPAVTLAPFFGLVWLVAAQPWQAGWRIWRLPSVWLAPFVWAFLLAAVYVALWPTMWVIPLVTLRAVADFAVKLGGVPHLWPTYFLGQPTTGDPGVLFYPIATVLRLGPVATIGLLLLAWLAIRRRSGSSAAVVWLAVFVVVFADVMTIGSKKFDRYMLPALAVLTILGGVGIAALARLLDGRLAVVVVALALLGQGAWLVSTYPYPIAAYNPLTGGTAVARQTIMVGWGEGLEQTAAFLNGLPGASQLTVSTQYHHVLRLPFHGRTVRVPNPRAVDYYVVYVNMIQRNTVPIPVRPALDAGRPVFTATVNGVPFAWVYQGPFQIDTSRDVPGEDLDDEE